MWIFLVDLFKKSRPSKRFDGNQRKRINKISPCPDKRFILQQFSDFPSFQLTGYADYRVGQYPTYDLGLISVPKVTKG